MKKYIALIALLAVTGCGGADKKDIEFTTTEMTTETEYTTTTEEDENEESSEEITQSETKTEEIKEIQTEQSFEEGEVYTSLKELANNAGFDISYEDNNVTFKTYITDDTIDYINEKDSTYQPKWEETCGLYEEFCSEALRTVRNGNADVNVIFEVVGRSNNNTYYRNENGSSVYDAYKHEASSKELGE